MTEESIARIIQTAAYAIAALVAAYLALKLKNQQSEILKEADNRYVLKGQCKLREKSTDKGLSEREEDHQSLENKVDRIHHKLHAFSLEVAQRLTHVETLLGSPPK